MMFTNFYQKNVISPPTEIINYTTDYDYLYMNAKNTRIKVVKLIKVPML